MACEDPSIRESLNGLREDYHKLSNDFSEWKHANAEEKKGVYTRIRELEDKAVYIPDKHESALIAEAAAFYKSKREFRQKLYQSLVEKGMWGLVVFIIASVFFYLKHMITGEL